MRIPDKKISEELASAVKEASEEISAGWASTSIKKPRPESARTKEPLAFPICGFGRKVALALFLEPSPGWFPVHPHLSGQLFLDKNRRGDNLLNEDSFTNSDVRVLSEDFLSPF